MCIVIILVHSSLNSFSPIDFRNQLDTLLGEPVVYRQRHFGMIRHYYIASVSGIPCNPTLLIILVSVGRNDFRNSIPGLVHPSITLVLRILFIYFYCPPCFNS